MGNKIPSNSGSEYSACLKQLEYELKEARAAAQAAEIAKSEFMAKISHEISTPMHAIVGMTELLLDTDLTKEQQEFTEVVNNATHTLLGIINNLLDFSRTESGQLIMNHLPFDLKVLVNELMTPFTAMARDKGLELNIRYAPGLNSRLIGDPGWLRQILSQLIHNAIRFTEQGQVFLNIEAVEDLGKSCRILYSIHDTGIGIPSEKLLTVFEDFSQGDNSLTRKYGGTGLGLTLCKELVDQMGGHMGVESQEGKGSTFWFSQEHRKDLRSPGRNPIDLHMDEVRVLVMEPNVISQRVIGEQLSSLNIRHDITTSENEAQAALERALEAQDPFDIVLLAFNSVDRQGETLAKAIQADPNLNETRVVVLSSSGRRGEADGLALYGAVAYLVKPVSESILCEALAAVWNSRNLDESRPLITRHSLAEMKKTRQPIKHTEERPRSILIVDDDEFFLKSTYRTIKNAFRGAEIQTAANGIEALILLGSMVPDCIVLDVMMPGMHGDELAQILQSKDRYRDVNIIAVTGLDETDQRVKNLRRKGIRKVFFKPFESEKLIKEVEEATRSKSIYTS
ncbi:MAG: response regulator [Planctomycetes bacterium]|nr:response regulator [Planctomycetota bacterium]